MDKTPILKQISFRVGDKLHSVSTQDVTPETSLNTYLREFAHLTGTKRMCLEGGCGSCVVAVEEIDAKTKKSKFFAINSCLVSIFSCHGWKIHTIEGIGGPIQGYHLIQKQLADRNGSQCGFCSSGMVMNMYALYESGPITQAEIENSFAGNICRCTGYRPILDAFKALASDSDEKIPDIEDYVPCYKRENCMKACEEKKTSFCLELGDTQFIKVYYLKDLLQILRTIGNKNYMLIGGNTAQGVYRPTVMPDIFIDISKVLELTSYTSTDDTLTFGATLSLNDVKQLFYDTAKKNPKMFSYLSQMADHIDLVANVPVRNIGTVAGNLMTKYGHRDFDSDIFLILETVNATLVIVDVDFNESRITPANFLNMNMNKKVIKEIVLQGYDDSYKYRSFKIMPRAQNAHAIVNAGFLFRFSGNTVKSATIVYGAINNDFVHASVTEKLLKSQNLFDDDILQQAYQSLDRELKTDVRPPEPPPEYRKQLAISLFYKYVLGIAPDDKVTPRHKSGATILTRNLSRGSQEYGTVKSEYPVTEPIIKVEALAQTTGQAEYIADIPDRPGQLHAAFVLANFEANSTVTKVDASDALKLEGVVAFYGKDDIPGRNTFMPKAAGNMVEEELFCSGRVQFYAQPVGIIVATSFELAERAADLVRVTASAPKTKGLLTIQDVLKANATSRIQSQSTFPAKRKGNDVKHVYKGTVNMGMQYHMHMEVQCCNVVPNENDTFTVYASSQWPDIGQAGVATLLGLNNSKINVVVRRLGGGFGGKISRNGYLTGAAAIAAHKLKKPVKMWMPLTKNMTMIGKRYPGYFEYEVGVNDQAVVQYLNCKIYANFGTGGNEPVNFLVVDNFPNMYNTETWNWSTYTVSTDTHANCWCRAPGSLEAYSFIENIFERLSYELGLDPIQVRLANMDPNRSRIKDYLTDLQKWADIDNRQKSVEEFNKNNRWKKKALEILPMVYVIQVRPNFSVVVSIFGTDGSVAVYHGGVEMGQGINTKVAQTVAYKFGISMDKVTVMPMVTSVTPNCYASGGSQTSETVCYAAIGACDVLLNRIAPVRKRMNNPTWEQLIQQCKTQQIFLCSTSQASPSESPYQSYQIYGTCATEIEMDILTGQHEVKRMDIIEDTGDSTNPLIDIGQCEGAIVMALGYYTQEYIVRGDKGETLTNRTWNYYVPGPKDIPEEFRIKFPANNPNPVGVLKSKAVSEPPCCLTLSIPFAMRRAAASAIKEVDSSINPWFPINGCSTLDQMFASFRNTYQQYTL